MKTSLYNAINAIGLILAGWILNELFSFLWKRISKKMRRICLSRKLPKALSASNGFLALDHAIPYYDRLNNITLRESNDKIFIAIPTKYANKLAEYKFVVRDEIIFNNTQTLNEFINDISPSSNEFIKSSIEEAAEEFLLELQNGLTRFNGLMYGVRKIRTERLTTDEKSGFSIEFYKTDYFTYRVFGKIYKKMQDDNKIFKIEKIQDINLYYPFLSSFGIGTFIIIDRGNGDEILLGRRSEDATVDGGKWHFSMNEAFTMKDKDEYGNPSFSTCLFRGLEEEIGISEVFKKFIKQHEFLDLYMNTSNIFEIGITSFARIEFNNIFTFDELMNLYSIAQDAVLETSSLIPIPIKEIDGFLTRNHNDISDACRGGLNGLIARYKAGYLRED